MIILRGTGVRPASAEASPPKLWDAVTATFDTTHLSASRDARRFLDEAMQGIGVTQSMVRAVRGHLTVGSADRWDQLELVTGSIEVDESTGASAWPRLQEVGRNLRLWTDAHADRLIHVGGNATVHGSASAIALRHIGGDAFLHDGTIILRGPDLVSNDTELPSLRTVGGSLSPNLSYLPKLFAVGEDMRMTMENTAPALRYVGRPLQLYAQILIEPASQATVLAIIRHDVALTRAATEAEVGHMLDVADLDSSTAVGLNL